MQLLKSCIIPLKKKKKWNSLLFSPLECLKMIQIEARYGNELVSRYTDYLKCTIQQQKECTSFCNKTPKSRRSVVISCKTDTYIQCYYKSLDKAELLKMMLCISTMNNFTPNDETNFWLHRLFFFF